MVAKTVTGSVSSPVTTEYAGNYIYNKVLGRGISVSLAFFNHPEGYVSNDSGSLNYVYQYKDHFEGGALIKGMVYLFSERASWRVSKEYHISIITTMALLVQQRL
ncbi:hypothetical protein TPENAI_60322 [Tenacibaculum litopenaei]|uniref:hypothetical protein n=1 Tax=Tenacibaculum litopenaei TaxID=396016 RepID=UPI0038930E64